MTKIVSVDFRDDTLFAAEMPDGVYVAITPICNSLGLAPNKQRERIQNDPILSEGGTVTVFPSAGGMQDTFCLRLDLVNGWLFTIDESRVKDDETRQRVLAYKRECYRVLAAHFLGQGETSRPDAADSLTCRRQLVAEARQTFGNKSARELWFALDLPIVPSMQAPAGQSDFGFTYTAIPKGA